MGGISRVLIANRGEIAVRILRACVDEGLQTVLVVSDADRGSLAAQLADRVVCIGPPSATESYLDIGRLLTAARGTGCDALHPGYGFVSERPELSEACVEAGIAFVGPGPDAMRKSGDKAAARATARSLGIPVGHGSDVVGSEAEVAAVAEEVGFPILLKAAGGGGGRGMRRVDRPEELRGAWTAASAEAQQAFGDGRLFVERFVRRARHVEVQVLADRHGAVVHLGHRDCTLQRRYQKLVEEAPAPDLPGSLSDEILDAAVRLVGALEYEGAATCEFLVDQERASFGFLEINARLQVEHPVSEMVTGVDVVREQLRIAGGAPVSLRQDEVEVRGHAVEVRVNAESPEQDFMPTPGRIETWAAPIGTDVRVDTACFPGWTITPYYDSLLAKVITRGADRERALATGRDALRRLRVEGVETTARFARDLLAHPDVVAARTHTRWIEDEFLPGVDRPERRLMARIELIDQSLRDGQQSLWGFRMRAGHVLPIADAIDSAGYRVVDLTGSSPFEVQVRYNLEDPWKGLDAVRAAFRTSVLRAGTRSNGVVGMGVTPDSIVELWVRTLGKHGIGSLWIFDCLHNVDKMLQVAEIALDAGVAPSPQLNFSLSPVHTDEYYAALMDRFAESDVPHTVVLGDEAGVLGPERARSWIRLMRERAGGTELEMHFHNRTGMASLNHIIGIEEGLSIVHTAISPMANGPSMPSTEVTIDNLRRLGHEIAIDDSRLPEVAAHLGALADELGYERGAPVEYAVANVQQQFPGGMMGTLQAQLHTYGMDERLPAVLEEAIQVRAEMGYPIMATPFSQLVGIQALLNVVQGERYLTIPDENLMYLAGHYGTPPGPLDQDVLDRAWSTERGKRMAGWSPPQPSLAEIRGKLGRRLSDEELLLRYLIPEPDVDAMYAAAAPIEPVFPATSPGGLGWIGDVIARRGPQTLSATRGNVTVELRR